MTTLYGKRLMKSLVFSVLLVIVALLTFAAYTPAQDTGSLETECVTLATAGAFVVPEGLTPQEYCKAGVAFLGSEWLKAIQLQAVITIADDLAIRMAAAEAEIIALKGQSSATLQPQIDAINVKLANMAAALQ